MNKLNTITIARDEEGNWTALYYNNKLVYENHSISLEDFLKTTKIPYSKIELTQEHFEKFNGELPKYAGDLIIIRNEFEEIMSRMWRKPSREDHKIDTFKLTQDHILEANLKLPKEGFEWYYTEDTMFLSGSSFFVQLDIEKKIVGDKEGFCIH
jgi:hypothetical protein